MYKLLAIVLVIGLAGLSSGQRRGSGWRISDWDSSDCRSNSQGCPCTRGECQQGSSDNYGKRFGIDSTSQHRFGGNGWTTKDIDSSAPRRFKQAQSPTQIHFGSGGWTMKDMDNSTPRRINQAQSSSQSRFGGNGWTTKDMDSSAPRRSNQAQSSIQSRFGGNGWTTKDMDSSAPRRFNQAQSSSQSHFGGNGWTTKDMDNSTPRRINQAQSSSQSHFGSGTWTTTKDLDSSAPRRFNQAQSPNQHRFGSNTGRTSVYSDSTNQHGFKDTDNTSERHTGNMSQGGYGTSNGARTDLNSATSQRRTGQRRYNSSTFSWDVIGISSGDRNRPSKNRMSVKDADSTSHYGYGENSMDSTIQHGDFSLYGKHSNTASPRVDRYGRNRH